MSKRPSVLVFSTQHMLTGGIESHLREFCKQISDSGIDLELVILNANLQPETEAFYRKICRKVYLGGKGRSALRLGWLCLSAINWYFKKFDAVYTNGQGNSVQLFSKLVPFRNTWVHHHHTAGDLADQATWTGGYKKALLQADSVIACSAKNARDISQNLQRPIKSIPCFSRQIVVKNEILHNPLRFGYYGRLIKEKGIETLCQLAQDKDLAGVEIHIWGEGASYPATYFQQYPQVFFHGSFSGEEELREVISNLDAYLLLSTHPEGLPIALLEVMSAGVPWIATNRGGISDIACDPNATRVISSDANYEEMKAAVVSLSTDIRNGKLDKKFQKDQYYSKFSSRVLVKQWRSEFGIEN
jgi:glycosyltransferase involved in cell wall biosynthesis